MRWWTTTAMLFQDRRDAGRVLAQLVAKLPDLQDAIVLGLPRGGVPVAFEVARTCQLPLDILVVRKLGAPGQRELAMGAVASSGIVVRNPEVLLELHVTDAVLRAVTERELREVERCERAYRGDLPPPTIEGRTVILVDDGLATGASMKAAARAVRPIACQVVIAVPAGARTVCCELQGEADRVICAAMPEPFVAVSQCYGDFEPTSDEEVRTLLLQARREWGSRPPASGSSE